MPEAFQMPLSQEVEHLGHVVSHNGVVPDPKKVEAVKEYPQPIDLKSLRSFLGLASYYRQFVPHFSKIASPLHSLTRKNTAFDWTKNPRVHLISYEHS